MLSQDHQMQVNCCTSQALSQQHKFCNSIAQIGKSLAGMMPFSSKMSLLLSYFW